MADWSDFELHFGPGKGMAPPPKKTSAGPYTYQKAFQLIKAAGGSDEEARILAAIAQPESKGNPMAYNGVGPDNSYGLWQINMIGDLGPERIKKFGLKSASDLYDPMVNAKAALTLARERKGYDDWSTYKNGEYKKYLNGEALAYSAPDWITSSEKEISEKKAATPSWIPPEEPQETQYPQVLPPPMKPTRWNAAASFGNGLTLGMLPQAVAGINAGYDYFTGQAPGGFGEDYSNRLAGLEEQRNIYQEQNPLLHPVLEGAGSIVPATVAIEGAIAPALGAAFTRAGAAPVARFFGGRAGEGMSGVGGAAMRRASYAGQGAAQGAAQGVLTQELAPDDTSLLEQVGVGAGTGAAVASVINPLISRLAAPLTAEIAPAVRKLALTAHDKYGIPLRVGQVAADREVQDLDKNMVDAALNNVQAEEWTRQIAKRIGASSDTLTKDAVEDAMRQTGKRMEAIASSTTLVPNQGYVNRLHDITLAARNNIVDDSTRNAVVKVLTKVAAETVRPGGVPGKVYQNLTQKGGLIDLNLTSSSNPILRKFGGDIKGALLELFEVNDPKLAGEWNALRRQYMNAKTVLPLAEKSPSGIINPKLLLARVNSKKVGGDMRELAEIGQYMTPTTTQGASKQAAKEGLLTKENLVAGGVGALGVGEAWPLLSRMLDAAQVSPAMAAIPLGLIGGGQYVGNKLLGKAMSSPRVSKAILKKRVPNFVQPLENVLVRGAVTPMLQVGAGKGK